MPDAADPASRIRAPAGRAAGAQGPARYVSRAAGSPLAALCVTEITSWGVLYYAFPVLAPAITHDTGWSTSAIMAGFSAALIVAALGGIPVGRALDRRGPRALMTGGSVLAVLAILGVAAAPNLWCFTAAWLLAGVAMSAVLYQPAFAALTRYYAPHHLGALTTVTLVAGLASTVFAPLTDALSAHLPWRGVYVVLAVVLAVVTVPLHLFALRRPWPSPEAVMDGQRGRSRDRGAMSATVRSRPFLLLAAALTLSAFAMFAVTINLIPLLISRGADASIAAWALGLGGVGQVTGRLGYRALARRTSVRVRTVWILAMSAATTAALATIPGPIALLITVAFLAGMMRGIGTLLQATAVSDRWGTASYGALSGILAAPITTATAISPFAGAALAAALGGYPHMFLVLTAAAVFAAVLAAGTAPGHGGAGRNRAAALEARPARHRDRE
ncbi:MFS transporter [Actinomadura darangshiensis]|uniref:MFS transporter n=1 Tax=Actinomadura darangshiensis TaxID=705336 RepID=A0A4R5BFZ0_9ACTN|nr:MFS transporter [Actinomadura darangshiensis]TDD83816.1 MFS transporter [Actinomadura darangshiensis]